MEVGADEGARDRRRALQHTADETDDRSEDPRAQRGRVVSEEAVAPREEDHDHERDEDRERALIEVREQQRPDRGAARRPEAEPEDPSAHRPPPKTPEPSARAPCK